ncbi:MAG TPA: hypothetical protein VKV30_14750 [Candidatus Angelobacter sp.]|nr:hypothetical protein [Candidatus Angelobacter sp.]
MRSCATAVLVVLLFGSTLRAQDKPQPQPTPAAFDAQVASHLLLQLSEALQGHSQKQFLALFDLARMKDGSLFKEQINSFFAQTESIRVHLNLADTSMEGDKAMLAVDAEMEAAPVNGSAITRKSERLYFAVATASNSWRFIELQPRSFFSLP